MPRKSVIKTTTLPVRQRFAPAGSAIAKFAVSDWARLERFLIIGTESNRYKSGPAVTTLQSASALERCVHTDGIRAVDLIVSISESGRAVRNDVAVFDLAAVLKLAATDDATRSHVYQNLHRVVRTGTHLLNFMQHCKTMKKDGRGLRKTIAEWYLKKLPEQAAYQILKYQSRDGWAHRDVLRRAHPGFYNGHKQEGYTKAHSVVFQYAVEGTLDSKNSPPRLLEGFIAARTAGKKDDKVTVDAQAVGTIVKLISDHNLSREMIPTEFLNSKEVWDALLQKMPMTAMIRNLGKMTGIGLVEKGSEAEAKIVERLNDEAYLRKSKVHPVQVLIAERVYRAGHGQKGSLVWKPTAGVNKALNEGFYKSFINAPITGKRHYIGVDCSGSMNSKFGDTDLKSIEAAMAMALVIKHAEPDVKIAGYAASSATGHRSGGMKDLDIRRGTYLDTACQKALALNWGSTDCGAPYRAALQDGEKYDVFINITDNDHNTGSAPHLALTEYREKTGIPAKQIVIGTYNSDFTIADPNDPGSLDIAGFDAAIPALVTDFVSDGKAHLPVDDQE